MTKLNPLSFELPADTVRAVVDVLDFVHHAILSDMEADLGFDNRPGLSLIISACQSALDAQYAKKVGAA